MTRAQYATARRLLPAVLAVLLSALPALAQKGELDVLANVSPENVLYFEGTLTPVRLCPAGQLQVHNDLSVLVEYVEKGGKFRELPDRRVSTADEAYIGNRLLEGERLEGRGSTLVEISGQEVFPEDEGQPFCVSGTVDLSGAQKFRIISRLRHQWAGTFPEVECFYDISGPYPVKAGVARKRQGGGLLSDIGRFLEKSVCEVGKGVVQVGGQAAGMLLAGGANPVGILQSLLLGEVRQQSGALGEALRFIGGAGGAGASTSSLQQVLSGGGSGQGNDLTSALVQGLVSRYGGELTSGGILGGTGATGPQFDVDNLIDGAVAQLERDLAGSLGLRNLRVDVDDVTAVIASQMPNLDGRGHLEPIIAYMLVDAALAAPWTQAVSAVFEGGGGNRLSIAAPAEAARNLARGQIDVETFLQLCRFADPDNPLLTGGGISGGAGLPTATAGAPQTLLAQSQLPPGWLASGTHPVNVADLDQIIPGLQLSTQSISWGGMQVVQTGSSAVTVLGLELGEVGRALQLVQLLENVTSGRWDNNLLHLATDPPLHALQSGGRTYLLQGEADAVGRVATALASGPAQPGVMQVGGLLSLLPGMGTSGGGASAGTPAVTTPTTPVTPPQASGPATPAAPAPAPAPVVPGLPGSGTSEPAPDPQAQTTPPAAPVTDPAPVEIEIPEPVKLRGQGYLRDVFLCSDVRDGSPVRLNGPLPAGTDRLGVYLEIKGAPRKAMLSMELIREGMSLGRRLMGAGGDRRTVSYFVPSGGFSAGRYWLEISADDTLASRILFDVK